MYHNSTEEIEPRLSEYRVKAKNQDDVVMFLFDYGRLSGYTPSEVQKRALPNAPLTSVRRSMTNLTTEGKLVKTSGKWKGIYGRDEFIWVLPDGAKQMRLI